ncbi:vascular endothelial growth factor receptor 1-like [Penaeus indicus]|uniref:vascular endothelial growth factor receptor 1-like n=1 Tax=Penaeus indicus TaxID=29960 RepID=UPI00300DA965
MGQRRHIKETFSLHFLTALLLLYFFCAGLCTSPDPCPDVPFSERERLNTCRVISRGRVSEQDASPEGCSRAFHVLFTRHFKAKPPGPVLQVSHPPGCSGSGWDRPHESVLDLEANQEYQFYLNGTDQQLHLVAAIRGRCARLPERKLAKREASKSSMRLTLSTLSKVWQKSEAEDALDIVEGDPIRLKCTAEVLNGDWIHNLKWEILDSANETGNVKSIKEHNVTAITRIATVNKADASNTGLYRCSLVVNGKKDSEEVRISVIAKDTKNVSVELDSPNIHMNSSGEDDSVTWILRIRAYPKPEIIWRKGDKVLLNSATPSGGGSRYSLDLTNFEKHEVRLTIDSPGLSDVGNHTVEAAVGDGSVADRVTLAFTMEVQAKVQSFRLVPSGRIWRMNDSFRITCLAEGYPRPSVELWAGECRHKDHCLPEEPVTGDGGANSTRLALQLDTTAAEEEELEAVRTQRTWVGVAVTPAIFVCMTNSSLGYNMSEPVKLLVTDTEWNVTLHLESIVNRVSQDGHNLTFVEGDNLTFTCYGNKMLTSKDLRWKLDGERLPREGPAAEGLEAVAENETDLSYIIKVAMPSVRRKENQSELVCYDESNPEVAVSKEFYIQAMEKPAWMPGVSHPQERIEAQRETELLLPCIASGTPTPKVDWYKDGVRIEGKPKNREIRNQELYFSYLLVGDTGEYKCVVRNRAGAIEGKTYVYVTDPDSPLSHKTMIIIVSISACALLFVVVFFCVRIYIYKKRAYVLRLEDHKIFVRGCPESLNPQLGLDQQADLLPYDTKYEVPRDLIIFDQLLGSGAFGHVYRATVLNLRPGKPRTTVAVKMTRSHVDSTQLKALRSELKIMMHIGRHMNIVNLLGACSKHFASKGELLLLVEYCKHGNILEYMRRHRKEFVDQMSKNGNADHRMRHRAGFGSGARTSSALKNAHVHFGPEAVRDHSDHSSNGSHSGKTLWLNVEYGRPSAGSQMSSASCSDQYLASDMSTLTLESSLGSEEDFLLSSRSGASETSFCTRSLFLWAFQIAKGMEYLAFKKVLHGDLAARNILLTEDNVVKISDFGLAKDIYRKENYHKKSKGPMPVKWLAIECLREGIFSTQSDVWSFGVVLWEIFSLGQNPYAGVEFDETFIAKVEEGVRLEKPKYATFNMYCTMRDCWAKNPLDRPSFPDLEARLSAMIGEANRQHFLELNQPYQNDNSDSAFISRLQSPDYSVKVHEGRTTGRDNSNEVLSSPGLYGDISLPATSPPGNTSPDQIPRGGPAGNYLTMSSLASGRSERPHADLKAEAEGSGTMLGGEGLGGHSASGLDVPAMQNNPGYYQNLSIPASKERDGLTTGGAFCEETSV